MSLDEKVQPPAWDTVVEDLLELGHVYLLLGKNGEAEKYLLRAKTDIERHFGKRHRWMALYQMKLAQLAAARNQRERAEEQFRNAITLSEQIAEREAAENGNLISYLQEYANWLRRQGRNKEAEARASQAERIRAKLQKPSVK